ncbi:hypothetical protein HispidOSU_011383 [Sigmodon hispidus]
MKKAMASSKLSAHIWLLDSPPEVPSVAWYTSDPVSQRSPPSHVLHGLCEARAETFSCEGVYICGTLLNICCGFPTAAMLKLWGDEDHEYSEPYELTAFHSIYRVFPLSHPLWGYRNGNDHKRFFQNHNLPECPQPYITALIGTSTEELCIQHQTLVNQLPKASINRTIEVCTQLQSPFNTEILIMITVINISMHSTTCLLIGSVNISPLPTIMLGTFLEARKYVGAYEQHLVWSLQYDGGNKALNNHTFLNVNSALFVYVSRSGVLCDPITQTELSDTEWGRGSEDILRKGVCTENGS